MAVSDPLGIIASPLTILTRQNSDADVQAIIDITRKKNISRIIVGLPFSMDGSLGIQAEKVRRFADELSKNTTIPLEYKDERLSTVLAKRLIQKVRKTNRGTRYDSAAAALILQSYLDDALPQREYQENEEPELE